MCGLIAAFTDSTALEPAIRHAMQQMHRRGPDGEGLWQDSGVCLGHRRLAILDLDERATQPMHSACGRYVIVFNGEIYNFRDLRDVLVRQGVAFRTTSDTEVILALFVIEGAAMLPKLHGMFAFVIWDRMTRRAFAARDPYGIKPLYVATTADGVLLASQVKALLATGLVSRETDPRGQAGSIRRQPVLARHPAWRHDTPLRDRQLDGAPAWRTGWLCRGWHT
jgi:asparagine synthase (glutamine-hydrolysing)